MLRGCVLMLVMLAGLMFGYYYWLDQVFEPPGSIIGGGVVGFLVLCCLGALNTARAALKDWSRLSSARFDALPGDGRLAAVSGTIHPVREPLVAPFSHTPCVLCEYDLAGPERVAAASQNDNSNSGSDYSGFLMVPCVIRTAGGEVRLLGFPIVEGFGEARCSSYAAARNAREFLRSTEFEDRTGIKMVSVLSVFGEIWTDDDGQVQKNMRLGKVSLEKLFPPAFNQDLDRLAEARPHPEEDDESEDDEDDAAPGGLPDNRDDETEEDDDDDAESDISLSIPKLVEKRVPVGAAVCAIGIYSEALGGLVPPGRSGPPNRLIKGTVDQVVSKSWSAIFRNFFGGLIGLAVIHGAIFGVMHIYRHSPEVNRKQRDNATQAVVRGELKTLASLVRRGLDVNFRDTEGRTLLFSAKEPEVVAWLIAHGADVNVLDREGESSLTLAARYRRPEIVKQLIAAKSDLNPRSKSTNQTPLAEALSRGHDEMAAMLKQAGAKE